MWLRFARWFQRVPGGKVRRLAESAARCSRFPRGELLATTIGAAPVLISLATGIPGHQLISAILLAWLLLGTIPGEQRTRGIWLTAIAFVVHCTVVIAATAWAPEATARIVPDADDYWQKQWTWITTGRDPEYALEVWLPRHAALAAAAIVWSVLSLGVITFGRGFYEVDLMNFYNGRLLAASEHQPLALLLGWHPWSLIRGAAFLILTWECVAAGYYLWTGVFVGTFRRRSAGWLAGIALLIADGVTKALLLEPVRAALQRNLLD